MRIVRAEYGNRVFYAMLNADHIVCLNKQCGFTNPIPLDQVRLLTVAAPSKIICMGLNYKDHAEEIHMAQPGMPLFFLKSPTTLIGPGQNVICPVGVTRLDFEAELAIIIGKAASHIAASQAPAHIFGYTCANDVTARNFQTPSDLGGRAKNFDTFCPVGPWMETELGDLDGLMIRALVNGEVKQRGSTADMILKPYDLVAYLSSIMTLVPGDLILTGTPPGVGPMHDGDTVTVEVDGIGPLTNTVVGPVESIQ